jgi:hypothetical protein
MNRPFRNRPFQANPLSPARMQILNQANRLLAAGQPGQAAVMFADLAQQLEASNHPRRAANLHAMAAHAFADSSAEAPALTHARAALTLFIQYQMNQRTPVFYANITRKLAAKGLNGAAEQLKKEFGAQVGPLPAPTAPPAGHAPLPTNCTKCGAPVRSDEASWVDANTIECNYCGSLIRSE